MGKQRELFEGMTNGSIGKQVVRLSLPGMFGAVVASFWNLIDSFYGAQIGEEAVAGIGAVFFVVALVQALGYWLGMGAGSILSKELGKQDKKSAGEMAASAIFASIILGIILTIIGLIFSKQILQFAGVRKESYEYAIVYYRYIAIGILPSLLAYVLGNILRSMGKMNSALFGTMVMIAVDIIANEALKNYLGKDMKKLGLSALMSQSACFFVLFIAFILAAKKMKLSIFPKKEELKDKFFKKYSKPVLNMIKMGSPSLFRQGTGSVAVVMLNKLAGNYSTNLQAAISVSSKLSLVLFSVAVGIAQGMQPLIGYNYGAGKWERVKKAFLTTVLYGTGCMILVAVAGYFFSPVMTSFFADDGEVQRVSVKILRYQCMAFPFVLFANAVNMLYQALQKPVQASIIASFRQGVCFLPLLFILNNIWQEKGIFLAQPLSDVVTCILCIPFAFNLFHKND